MKKDTYIITLFLFVLFFTTCKPTEEQDEFHVVDDGVTAETYDLYHLLKTMAGRGTMIGHHDDLAYGINWYGKENCSDVKSACGDYPAVFGWDVGNIEVSAADNIDSVSFNNLKQYICRAHRMGGISAVSWHVHNPVTEGSAMDCGPDTTVRSVLPGHAYHEKYILWLGRLAFFLRSLKDKNGVPVPIIFRPYPEMRDERFWWSDEQCSPDEFRQLWKMTINYLKETENLHHLIYAYSTSQVRSMEDFSERYPGDDYVDMVGFNDYLDLNTDSNGSTYKQRMKNGIDVITRFAEEHDKVAAITETGLEGIKLPDYYTHIILPLIENKPVGYILFRSNSFSDESCYYVPVPGHPACDDFVAFIRDERIFTLKNIQK